MRTLRFRRRNGRSDAGAIGYGSRLQAMFGVTVRGTDPHRLYSLTQAPLSIQRGIRLHRTETELLDVHFISSSPVELQLAYRVEGIQGTFKALRAGTEPGTPLSLLAGRFG